MADEREKLEPGSPEWQKAWTDNPSLISSQLTPAERCNPELNPLHPYSSSTPPGVPMERRLGLGWPSRSTRDRRFYD